MTNSPTSEINSEDDLFYFESDHLALRGNKDYSDVLKNLLILCAQRKKSLENYSKTVELKKEALADPSSILEKIVKGESLGVPDMCRVPEIPVIDWSKYNTRIPEESLKDIYADDNNVKTKKKLQESPKKDQEISHKRWTTEEQKRLEELLQIYPPEPVELRRFKKIADALGNRTIQQVTSRVQKYFVKLYKAGLPIPGRIPKSAERYKRGLAHKHQRHNHYLWKPTTFFPDLCVPVVMTDLDDAPGPSTKSTFSQKNEKPTTSSNYLISTGYHEDYNGELYVEKTETELQLDLLKRIRKAKIKENSESSSAQYHHLGFKCDFCSEEPIVGTRWHCISCKTESVDFCTDCALAQMYSENSHNLKHKLVSYSEKDGVESESEQECLNHNETSDESSEESDPDDAMSDVSLPTEKKLNNIPEEEEEEFRTNNSSTNYNDIDLDGFPDTYPTGSDLFDDIDNISKLIEKH